jgi:hypothetical protein
LGVELDPDRLAATDAKDRFKTPLPADIHPCVKFG